MAEKQSAAEDKATTVKITQYDIPGAHLSVPIDQHQAEIAECVQ